MQKTLTGNILAMQYLHNFTGCHGSKGKGDGIAAAGLAKPADHSSDNVQNKLMEHCSDDYSRTQPHAIL